KRYGGRSRAARSLAGSDLCRLSSSCRTSRPSLRLIGVTGITVSDACRDPPGRYGPFHAVRRLVCMPSARLPPRSAPRQRPDRRVDLYEYQAKELFTAHDVPGNPGIVTDSVDGAVAAAEKLGTPVMVKAQVKTGGRGKAGGVKFA